MSMVTATTWVPRGFAAPFPTKYSFDQDEFDRVAELARLQLDDAKEDLQEAEGARNGPDAETEQTEDQLNNIGTTKSTGEIDDDLKEYDLEHYDDEEPEDHEGSSMGMFGNVKALVYHESNEEDPYITLNGDELSDEEREELQILKTDNLLLAAKLEDEVAHLEVYVYEDEADNLYVHHDIMLPAIPLALEWLDLPVGRNEQLGGKGNFVAVGTMDPDIELWDLDTVDCMYPSAILGQGADDASRSDHPKKKKKKKSKKANDDYHVDAVLSLAANRQHRNLLVSSSADKTVKLWDLNTTKCAKSYSYHTDKVSSLAWHPKEATVLLSGSYDRTITAADMRAPGATMPRWGVESDVEMVKWDAHDTSFFYVATENGMIHYHDTRAAPSSPANSKPVWTLQAHNESVNSFDVNPIIPGFLVSGSSDKEAKLWNVQPTGPSMVVSRNLGVGKVFSTSFAPDQAVGFRLAVAGSKGTVQVWDTSTNAAVRHAFAGRVAVASEDVEERLIGVAQDSSESEDGEGDEDEAADDAPDGWESMEE